MKGLGETIVEHRDKGECHCRGCTRRIPFEMPDQLAEAYVRGDLIVFAGAGASTESEDVLSSTLYTHIHELLGMEPDERETFPALMERDAPVPARAPAE